MAIRKKTIEFPFVMRTTSLALATRHDFSAITVYIPETTTRTFTSVVVEINALQAAATAASLTSELIGIKLGAVAFSDASMTDTMTNSGEVDSWVFTRDVTSYFTTNFGAAATQTCQVGVQFGAVAVISVTAKLIITYTYDDASQTTRVKTVRIPLESQVGALTATTAQMGTNQIPALDTFLPESTKTYRAVWIEVEGNDGTVVSGGVAFNYEMKIDSGGTLQLDGSHASSALESPRWWKAMFDVSSMTKNATHQYFHRTTSIIGGTINHISVILYVTYEYDHTASTTIMNSLVLPFSHTTQAIGHTTTADKSRRTLELWVEEPGAITLVQSGVWATWNCDAAVNVSIACGAQTARAYTSGAGALQRGTYATMQRIDSAAAQGVGMTLARGKNTLTIDAFGSSASVLVVGFDGLVYLNYTSGKHPSGADVHNHTIIESWIQTTADAVQLIQAQDHTPSIPETSYWAWTGLQVYHWIQVSAGTTGTMAGYVGLSAEAAAGEHDGAGFELLSAGLIRMDPETGIVVTHGDGLFNRYTGDTRALMDLETARTLRYDSLPQSYCLSAWIYYTYHAITYTVAGALVGYSGDGSGATVNLHRADTDEKVLTATTTSGGNYTFTWYDDTTGVYVTSRQAAGRVGRSDTVTPT